MRMNLVNEGFSPLLYMVRAREYSGNHKSAECPSYVLLDTLAVVDAV